MKRLSPIFILTIFYCTSTFIFFGFIYKYHLFFEEQQQLFLLSESYFHNVASIPGGFLTYLGEFLTQFYYKPLLGASIITFFLFLVQLATIKLLNLFKENEILYPLSFLPPTIYGLLLCNNYYMNRYGKNYGKKKFKFFRFFLCQFLILL